ncbi:MAG: aldo/keto reductase [Verrucomicrobiota bacterium]
MEKRRLGRSGLAVTPVGMGCWAIGGESYRNGKAVGWAGADDAESLRAIGRAVELGANLFDTASNYGCGHSERLLGRALEGRRDEVILATKFSNVFDEETRVVSGRRQDAAFIRESCEASLRRLRTDYLDLFQFHDGEAEHGEEVRAVLENLVSAGKIRWYGWSTDHAKRARLFAEGTHCAAIQQGMNVFGGHGDTLEVCEKQNLASLIRSPLMMGLLTGKFTRETKFPPNDVRQGWDLTAGHLSEKMTLLENVRDVLTCDGRSLAQGALAWLWARSPVIIPLPGFKSVAQVEDNLGALEHGPMPADQFAEVERLLGRERS